MKKVDYIAGDQVVEVGKTGKDEELDFNRRVTKIMMSKASGNASEASLKYRVGLPNAWMSDMNISKENRTLLMERIDKKTIKLTLIEEN